MKKLFFSLLFVALSAMAFAQQWTSISKSNPSNPEVSLISSSEKEVVVAFTLGGFELTEVNTQNGIQNIVSVPKMASMLEAGAPDLPQFPIPAIIGDKAEMEVSIVKSTYTDYENIEVAPSKGNFSRQIDPATVPYTYGAMYSQNAFYPAAQAYLEAPYIIRDFRGQNIMVCPFAYNPVTKTLRVYSEMTISMKKVSDNGVNQKVARKASSKMSPEMDAAYSHRFINYKESVAKYPFTQDLGEMLIICPDQYMEAMQPLVDWKNQSGRPTTMVSLTQAGGNSDTQINNYLTNFYNDPSHNLVFVLLVGDYADLTPHSMNGGRSDNWFGQIEGNDNYLEVLTGRFSVQSVADVTTHVNKVLFYERDVTSEMTWPDNGLGIGHMTDGPGHYGEYDYQHIDLIRDTLLHYTYGTVTELHQGGGASASSISSAVNNGVGIINYCNHGSETSWGVANYSTSHVNALTNDYKLPFIWSVACLNGKFDYSSPCFGEAWLRATNNSTGAPTGAVGGMFSWISQPWQPPMYGQDEMVDILTEWKNSDKFCHTLGGASLNGSMYILDAAASDNGDTFNTWLLFGDPSLLVRTDTPTNMNVSFSPSVLMLGMSSLEVTTQNTAYGIATLMMNGEVIASAGLHNNMAVLNFPPMSNVGNATLTVIGYNKVTEIIDIEVLPAEGPYVTVASYTPSFSAVNQETSMSITFKNVGVDPTNGTTNVTLNCESTDLTIINGTGSFNSLSPEATTTVSGFRYSIADGVAEGTRFTIDVIATCGSDTWEGKAYITAGEAMLEFVNATGGSFTPGETITVMASFKNAGHYMATNAIATISSTSQYVSFESNTYDVGTIDPDGTATCVFNVIVNANCPTSEQLPLTFTLNADGGITAEGSTVIKNSCDVIFSLHDSYGDGWNGCKLRVSFSDGTPSQDLTINSGSQAEYTLSIGINVHVTLNWINGSYASECSFEVTYEDGTMIVQASAPSSSWSYGFDCDCGTATNLDPVTDLSGEINGNEVTLYWNMLTKDEMVYHVYRNGVEIGQTTETTYTDMVYVEMVYTYCVVAEMNGNFSVPSCVQIEFLDAIEESEVEFAVYPNPVNGTLFVNGGNAEYTYEMFNGMGQKVVEGKASGNTQINVNGMAKGVYFLRLTSGTQIRMEKVVVE